MVWECQGRAERGESCTEGEIGAGRAALGGRREEGLTYLREQCGKGGAGMAAPTSRGGEGFSSYLGPVLPPMLVADTGPSTDPLEAKFFTVTPSASTDGPRGTYSARTQ